jgi:hypothetical protein
MLLSEKNTQKTKGKCSESSFLYGWLKKFVWFEKMAARGFVGSKDLETADLFKSF